LATQEDISSLQAPLVFGVTGHRDLRDEDIAALEQKVRDIFDDFRAKYPSTPFLLLSPLAEGADRLVARVALGSGARLIAPLPLPQSLYETDFETPESIAQFRELLASADESFALDLLANEDTVRPKGPLRDKEYEKVGKYIARESQVLIALWDGTDPAKVGGTAAIVRFQTEGPDRGPCDWFPPELFPVYHIITPRVSNGKTPIDALQLKVRIHRLSRATTTALRITTIRFFRTWTNSIAKWPKAEERWHRKRIPAGGRLCLNPRDAQCSSLHIRML